MSARVIESVSLQAKDIQHSNLPGLYIVRSVSVQTDIRTAKGTQSRPVVDSTSLALAGYEVAGTQLPMPPPLPPLASVARRKRTWRE